MTTAALGGVIWRPLMWFTVALLSVVSACRPSIARAQGAPPDTVEPAPQRPTIIDNRRWQEDWSVLADPRIAREPLDGLKYMPFSRNHPKMYVSLGLNVRERFEVDHAPFFGIPPGQGGEWGLSRLEVYADIRLGGRVQIFTQLQSAFAPGKDVRAPVDQDRLDLEQAFIGVEHPLAGGTLRVRLGRQLFAIDLQRFASVRDGPNLRQAFDAAHVDYERGSWRVIGAYTRPVQTRDLRPFDDYSDRRLTFSGVLLRRQVGGVGQLTASYARYTQAAAIFVSASGDETRDSVDVRFNGAAKGFDWDIEAMNQTGRVGPQRVEARALGLLGGYTVADMAWTPRLGISLDVATGDHNARDNTLETFNPLFPEGYYLANYTGYPNVIHLKPALTVHPMRRLEVMTAFAGQWRQTIGDAIYIFPGFPLAGTANTPGRYTGMYGEVRGNWTITPYYSIGFDAVHYAIGTAVRRAGGHDASYASAEVRFGW